MGSGKGRDSWSEGRDIRVPKEDSSVVDLKDWKYSNISLMERRKPWEELVREEGGQELSLAHVDYNNLKFISEQSVFQDCNWVQFAINQTNLSPERPGRFYASWEVENSDEAHYVPTEQMGAFQYSSVLNHV